MLHRYRVLLSFQWALIGLLTSHSVLGGEAVLPIIDSCSNGNINANKDDANDENATSTLATATTTTITRQYYTPQPVDMDEVDFLPLVTTALHTSQEETKRQKQRLVEWLVDQGGHFSDKISMDAPPGSGWDSDVIGGLFAVENIAQGEEILRIPEHCLVRPDINENDNAKGLTMAEKMCRTAERLVREYFGNETDAATTTTTLRQPQQPQPNPFVQYMFESFPFHLLPQAWSHTGRVWMQNLVGTELLSPEAFGQDLIQCHDLDPQRYASSSSAALYTRERLNAAHLIVQSRSWHETLVPLLDMANHRNGEWHNIDQKDGHNDWSQRGVHDQDGGFSIVALRDIRAGEQLYGSYNECHDVSCKGMDIAMSTPYMFATYGFVEEYPQRWPMYYYDLDQDVDLRLLWDVDSRNSTGSGPGELEVRWRSEPPTAEQHMWLGFHLERLRGMEKLMVYAARQFDDPYETEASLVFYKALVTALEAAIASVHQENSDNAKEEPML